MTAARTLSDADLDAIAERVAERLRTKPRRREKPKAPQTPPTWAVELLARRERRRGVR